MLYAFHEIISQLLILIKCAYREILTKFFDPQFLKTIYKCSPACHCVSLTCDNLSNELVSPALMSYSPYIYYYNTA